MVKKLFKNLDYGILIIVFILFFIGMVSLKSASQGAGGDPEEFTKQFVWFTIGMVAVITMIFFDYKIIKKLSIPIYALILILLILVLKSNPTNGATSWFKVGPISIQPSEFAKLAVIMMLAMFIDFCNERKGINMIYNLFFCSLIVAIPTLLIIKQPDYGTAIVMIVIFSAMIFAGGINWKYIVAAIIVLIISAPLVYNFILPSHAKKRIEVFINPETDPRGAGYNIIQSKLAVGSGMIFGMGLFNGNQTQMGLLPMKTTDFIFPVISEEMGFVVSSSVIILFAVLLVRIINLSRSTKDNFGKLICIGIFAMIFAHYVENIGMCMGLLPITGIPLPFISYGGSSMLTNMISVGLLCSIAARRKKHII